MQKIRELTLFKGVDDFNIRNIEKQGLLRVIKVKSLTVPLQLRGRYYENKKH